MSAPEYFFPHVGAFVHEWLLLMVNRKVNNRETFLVFAVVDAS